MRLFQLSNFTFKVLQGYHLSKKSGGCRWDFGASIMRISTFDRTYYNVILSLPDNMSHWSIETAYKCCDHRVILHCYSGRIENSAGHQPGSLGSLDWLMCERFGSAPGLLFAATRTLISPEQSCRLLGVLYCPGACQTCPSKLPRELEDTAEFLINSTLHLPS